MKTLAVLALVSTLAMAGCVHPPVSRYAQADKAAVHLEMNGEASCSGTVISPHAILSATHCFVGLKELTINSKVVSVVKQIDDGHDHTILVLKETLDNPAQLGPKPDVTDIVFVFGNPGPFVHLFREGRVSGTADDGKGVTTLYDLNGWFGDSGSGIFDSQGRLVGVVSTVWAETEPAPLKFMGSFDLAFTTAQLAEAGA